MGPIDIEICSNCGREISRSEQAYIFEGNIACAECDRELRSGPKLQPAASTKPQPELPGPSKPKEVQEGGKRNWRVDKPVGFIIAGAILCLLGVVLIDIGLAGLAVFYFGGFLIGMLVAGGCVTSGMLILILGVAAIVVAVISHRRSTH